MQSRYMIIIIQMKRKSWKKISSWLKKLKNTSSHYNTFRINYSTELLILTFFIFTKKDIYLKNDLSRKFLSKIFPRTQPYFSFLINSNSSNTQYELFCEEMATKNGLQNNNMQIIIVELLCDIFHLVANDFFFFCFHGGIFWGI